MSDKARQDETVQQAIRDLFIGSIPERGEELTSLWNELDPVFQLVPDIHEDERVIMDAGAFRFVRFNHRVVRSFWIGAFAAWEAYRAFAESEDTQAVDLAHFRLLVVAFEANIQNDQSDAHSLPTGIPEPGTLPNADREPQARAASELAIIAVAWAMLHEIRHIRHQREGTSAPPLENTPEARQARHEEEFSCDDFATKFILEHVNRFAEKSGDDPALVRRKRAMAIYFALFALVLLAKDRWDASNTHPSVQDRINAVCLLMKDNRDELPEAIACTVFKALRRLWPAAPMIEIVGDSA
ncbi:phage exclusion protein Lit family protein [Pseudovibrio sp. POLY-S9]|uniref:phage exclusion protein Lit family protein n=1 Tax=Pseudovibrio sp. POLY-S9 TaxID=1576596 RepID=UPI00070EC9AE|nr:phage exclusion protein Lit family protein [Pseudovibrio sp. POLY-S9]